MEGDSIYISLQEATQYCGYTQEYLSLRARQGKLKAVKFGRNWVTKKEWLDEYLQGNHSIEIIGTLKPSLKFPFEITPKIRFGFLTVLVLVMMSSGIVFGKDSFKNVYRDLSEHISSYVLDLDFAVTKFGENTDLAVKEIFATTKNTISLGAEGGEIVFSDMAKGVKSFSQNFSSSVIKFNEDVDEFLADYGRSFVNVSKNASLYTYIIGSKVKNFFADSIQSFKNVYRDLDFQVAKINENVDGFLADSAQSFVNVSGDIKNGILIISTIVKNTSDLAREGAVISAGDLFGSVRNYGGRISIVLGSISENLKEFSQWLARQPFAVGQKIVEVYTTANDFVEQKLGGFASQTFVIGQKIVHPVRNTISGIPDFVRSVISNRIQGYFIANNLVEQKLGELVQKYLSANNFVKRKIIQAWQDTKNFRYRISIGIKKGVSSIGREISTSVKVAISKGVEGIKGIPEMVKNYGDRISVSIRKVSRTVLGMSKDLISKIIQGYLVANDFVEKKIVQGYKAFAQLFKAPERISEEKLLPKPTKEGLVVIPSTGKDEEVVKKIKESFSDEVKVEPKDETSGFIIPIFKKDKEQKYLYILVPIQGEN
jgi:hypothetical protein